MMTERSSSVRSVVPSAAAHSETGMAIVWAVLLMMVGLLSVGALSTVILAGARSSRVARSAEVARTLAEGGIGRTTFQIEAATNQGAGRKNIESYLATTLGPSGAGGARAGSYVFSGALPGGTYTTTLTDSAAGDNVFTLTSVGRTPDGRTRTIVALVREEPVAALSYALFGNRIHFDNHNKVVYGLNYNTSMHSNSTLLIDRGVSVIGPVTAVNSVEPNTGPASHTSALPNTILSPAGRQGDPNPITGIPTAPVVQAVPAPSVIPFPTFDFAGAADEAAKAGRSLNQSQLSSLISAAQSYAAARPADGTPYALAPASYPSGLSAPSLPIQVIHYKTSASNPHPRDIAIPNLNNPNAAVPLGSPNGSSNPASGTNLYEIQFLGSPTSDTLIYVTGALNLSGPTTTLLQFQGSLIVNGLASINAPTEILAWHNRVGPKFLPLGESLYTDASGTSTVASNAVEAAPGQPYDVVYSNWPALAANGRIKIDNSGGSSGGPVHIEGPVYSVAESHIHKSNSYESSYAVGSEIADVIHNCQWFSFAYDPRARFTRGFSSRQAGRTPLQIIRLEDRP